MLARVLLHVLEWSWMVLARVVIHVLARVLPHVLARSLLHVLARVIIHVHDYYSKTCNQDGFRWKLYKSRTAWLKAKRQQDGFVERSTKAGWLSFKALRKQDGFLWKLYESEIAFVESSKNARWLWLKAMWKPFKKRVNRNNTKFRDKIAYVGAPFLS